VNSTITTALAVALIAFALIATLGTWGRHDSSWYPTQTGAIRVDAYDYVDGKIGITTAPNRNSGCKDYQNDLARTFSGGINGAVEALEELAEHPYYYYKATASARFYKLGPPFILTLYQSPVFYKAPRVTPKESVLLAKLEDLSIASQMEITKALKDEHGHQIAFTADELAHVIQNVAGKQKFDVVSWVISNIFDKDQQAFLSCVPDSAKLAENPYREGDSQKLETSLRDAEKTLRAIIPKRSVIAHLGERLVYDSGLGCQVPQDVDMRLAS
jgi:hypothetical protein